ncbi:MAG: PsiF family protein [Polaromonas sp.]
MKKLLSLTAVAFALSMGLSAAQAADAPAKTAQQSKMASCNKDATGKKGDERKAFMKECLSAKSEAAPATPVTQQSKMKTCNVDAKGKKGDERKAFMKECLSK